MRGRSNLAIQYETWNITKNSFKVYFEEYAINVQRNCEFRELFYSFFFFYDRDISIQSDLSS